MKLYIPNHLRKIKIVDQLVRMLSEYKTGRISGESYIDTARNPLDDYRISVSQTPVYKFLYNWLDVAAIEARGMKLDAVLSYLIRRFYSIKGTKKVLDDLSTYLFPYKESETPIFEYKYSIEYLELSFSRDSEFVKISKDPESFKADLYGFLNELLYFGEEKVTIDTLQINVLKETNTYICANFVPINNTIIQEK